MSTPNGFTHKHVPGMVSAAIAGLIGGDELQLLPFHRNPVSDFAFGRGRHRRDGKLGRHVVGGIILGRPRCWVLISSDPPIS